MWALFLPLWCARADEQPTEIESADDARPILGGQRLPDDRTGAGAVLTNYQWPFENPRSRRCGPGFDVDITLSASTGLSEKITLSVQFHQPIRRSARPYAIYGRQAGRPHLAAKRDDGIQGRPFSFCQATDWMAIP